MMRKLSTSLIKSVSPVSKSLLAVPRVSFATNPFNNPYGDK